MAKRDYPYSDLIADTKKNSVIVGAVNDNFLNDNQ